MVDLFSNSKDVQNAMEQDWNMDTIMKISVAYGQPLLLYGEN